MDSLQAHLNHIVTNCAVTNEWRNMDLLVLCKEIELRVEAAHPDFDECDISARCHRRLRKIGKALRMGWELELLGCKTEADVEELRQTGSIDVAALVDRLDTLGAKKVALYKRFKAVDRAGTASLHKSNTNPGNMLTEHEYKEAVVSTQMTTWHRTVMAKVVDVFKQQGAKRIIDVGSGFNPLEVHFPQVTAVDAVSSEPTIFEGDFLKVDVVDGLTNVRTDPLDPQHCLAVPGSFYDAALVSLVLRSLGSVDIRRKFVSRVAQTLRLGGVFAIVERRLPSLVACNDAGYSSRFWREAGLRRTDTFYFDSTRGTCVYVFKKI